MFQAAIFKVFTDVTSVIIFLELSAPARPIGFDAAASSIQGMILFGLSSPVALETPSGLGVQ